MTDEERAQYAREQREACRPLECNGDDRCWTVHGGGAHIQEGSMQKAPRCAACGGKLRWQRWKEPPDLALSTKAQLLARDHGRKRQLDVS